ncbi:hypothetical protein [Rudaeicoccus suwonensis]|uniref:Transmembrane protein n=1 Tax=Rudaeicoccus suwonensis TaxID=657409 RepID=A0A561EAI7_9MICO|nr:hypothetical protein [Rudaeicoccus suwonensis]TWE12625.1 hypothetical protein BKA23_1440 [Rudaeicoccus suwonensis]
MSAPTVETRTVIRLRNGSKICVLIAIALVAVGVYYYFLPVKITSANGIFGCGSAAHPPSGTFQTSTCQDLTHVNLFRTYLFVGVGIITAALGSWMFGVDRQTQVRHAVVESRQDDGLGADERDHGRQDEASDDGQHQQEPGRPTSGDRD